MVQRVVVNWAVGGFSVSKRAFERLCELGEPTALEMKELMSRRTWLRLADDNEVHLYIDRDSPLLFQVIDEMGLEAVGPNLEIVEVPDGVKWRIASDDPGNEWVQEVSRSWHPKRYWSDRETQDD